MPWPGESDLLRQSPLAFNYQESATTLIGSSGNALAHLPYGEGVLVQAIDPETATGLFASHYVLERYREARGG